MKVIVVGSSHGGFEAVRGILAENLILKSNGMKKEISFHSCLVECNYISKELSKNVNSVRYATAKGMRAKGVNVFVHQEVTSIDPKAHTVTVHNLDDDSTREENTIN